MDTTTLRAAHLALLDAAALVDKSGGSGLTPSDGGWNADQILGHVALVDAATLATAASIAAGANVTFDNRALLDTWTIDNVTAIAVGSHGLRDRLRALGEALCLRGASVVAD